MGIFKDSINFGLEATVAFLIKLGFEYGERSGAQGETGYTKIIHHTSHCEKETLWITVDLIAKEVHLYDEWDCGGELWQKTLSIPPFVLNNEEEFINWLDEKIEEG